MRHILLAALLLSSVILSACATPYAVYDDKRLMDTMADDKGMATNIKSALMKAHFKEGWDIAVYCYYGKVYLVGEIPPNMQAQAVEIAKKYKPRSVTTHWFTPLTVDTNDFFIATQLRTDLIGTKGLSSTRVDTEVNSGRVVLLGVVANEAERQLAINTAKKTPGVTKVTSYLLLPM